MESKSLRGYLRENTEWMPQTALKEKSFVEEENLQDHQERKQVEKRRHWKKKTLHEDSARQTAGVAGGDLFIHFQNGQKP